jgi:hypothetical protein
MCSETVLATYTATVASTVVVSTDVSYPGYTVWVTDVETSMGKDCPLCFDGSVLMIC